MPLLVEKRLADNWHVGVYVREIQVKVVEHRLLVWHELWRYADLETGTGDERRKRTSVLIRVLESGLLFVSEGGLVS
jgi:hypothetical protein